MKKSLLATLVVSSMLSPIAFAAEPMQLSTVQMDSITAGEGNRHNNNRETNINIATTLQIVNQQAIAVNFGNGSATAVAVASVSNKVNQH